MITVITTLVKLGLWKTKDFETDTFNTCFPGAIILMAFKKNKQRQAGVSYEEFIETGLRMPCFKDHFTDQENRQTWPCDLFQLLTLEEAKVETEEWLKLVERSRVCRQAARADAKAKGLGKGHNGYHP